MQCKPNNNTVTTRWHRFSDGLYFFILRARKTFELKTCVAPGANAAAANQTPPFNDHTNLHLPQSGLAIKGPGRQSLALV
ncbi:hypothetical protein E2C01_010313 [Portunus trituberculatus]|uniref:Uncharacterized protein n=1 Tax=Portunus trituberculatus TaxID=210409 RepID=A0A5B7D8A9_PORTR|nr:hypothetical protein [Portunus trituberculatus]